MKLVYTLAGDASLSTDRSSILIGARPSIAATLTDNRERLGADVLGSSWLVNSSTGTTFKQFSTKKNQSKSSKLTRWALLLWWAASPDLFLNFLPQQTSDWNWKKLGKAKISSLLPFQEEASKYRFACV